MNEKKESRSHTLEIQVTATADLVFPLVNTDVWIREGNFVISDNSMKYGFGIVGQTIPAGGTFSFQDFNLKDLFFKNAAAGANGTISFVGILMTEGKKKDLGVI